MDGISLQHCQVCHRTDGPGYGHNCGGTPTPCGIGCGRVASPIPEINLPISLRDYFAAKAFHAFVGMMSDPRASDWDWDMVAREAYRMSDAMLRAREASQS